MRVQRIVDLSILVHDGTQVFPGDPVPSLRQATRIETEGFNVLSVALGSHTGTHVDAPYHTEAGGRRLEDLDLSLFVGPGVIADVTQHQPRRAITWRDLEPVADRLRPGAILLLHTDWSERHLGTSRYYDHPFLDTGAAREILARGVRTIAIDALNPDETVVDGTGSFPVHELVLGAGGVIAENLTSLSDVAVPDPLISMLPIRLGGDADGAPCRAVALELTAD